jgi:hypothetical protein
MNLIAESLSPTTLAFSAHYNRRQLNLIGRTGPAASTFSELSP